MIPRPRLRLPLWAAFAIVAAAYVVRSVGRGMNFRPDMPVDAIVAVLLIAVVILVAWARGQEPPPDDSEPPGTGNGADSNS